MRAVLCRKWGGPEDLTVAEVPSRALQPGEVRLRVRACGVNFPDTLIIAGKYQVKPEQPFIPGFEAAGEIIEVAGDVEGLAPGRRVLVMTRSGGCYADELVVPARSVVPIPDAMDFVTAAGFPMVYGTAHLALIHRGQLKQGETLLVTGAAGGVGLAAVEIGKRIGARVIAAAGSTEKLAVAAAHGADEGIDYTRESLRDRVKALTDGRGADVVFDPVGGDAFDQALRAVNWEARMLVVGFASGRIPTVATNLILVKNISVIGVVWGAQTAREPDLATRNLRELVGWWQAGKLKPEIAATFPLEQAADALNALLSRRLPGKIVMTCG